MKFPDDFDIEAILGQRNPRLYGIDFKLRKDASKAFNAMSVASKKDGFKIKPISSYRSFDDQKRIWNRKYMQFLSEGLSPLQAIDKIIEYSTIPGTSRHHWGTDIDIVDGNQEVDGDVLLSRLFDEDGPYFEFKLWLNQNASNFDFVEVYTSSPERKGFKYEPWHFSYAPLSTKILEVYSGIDFNGLLKSLSIEGSSYFTDEFINRYWTENILDINPLLKV